MNAEFWGNFCSPAERQRDAEKQHHDDWHGELPDPDCEWCQEKENQEDK